MVLVFIFCTILIIISLLTCMILLSTIRFGIRNLEASNTREKKQVVSGKFYFIISLYLNNRIKWLTIRIDHKKIQRMYQKLKLEEFNFKQLEQDFKFEDLKQLKRLEPRISYFYLESKIGTEDVIATSFLVAILSTIISFILPHTIKIEEKNNYYYQIVPLYLNQNLYEIKFDCIIEVKMVHIISILIYFIKKRRESKNERRASNRRAYDYSYE